MGHVEKAAAVLRREIEVIERTASLVARREEPGVREHIIVQAAPRVVEASAPAVAQPLFELGDQRMIPGSCTARLAIPDVAELRIRSQQLPPGNCGRGGERSRLGNAEKRVGYLLSQRGAERQVLRIELVDVDKRRGRSAVAQVVAARS